MSLLLYVSLLSTFKGDAAQKIVRTFYEKVPAGIEGIIKINIFQDCCLLY